VWVCDRCRYCTGVACIGYVTGVGNAQVCECIGYVTGVGM
jgi:hypothetical protein